MSALKNSLLTGLVVALACALAVPSLADVNDARVTEVWVGLGGGRPDGTHDWIEVTNTGVGVIDTSDLAFDDENPSFTNANVLDSVLLGPGESAIFLLDVAGDNPMFDTSIEEFLSVWVPFDPDFVADAGFADKLSTSGDEANLFNRSTGAIVDTLTYPGGLADTVATIERTGESPTDVRMSVLGENAAFESQVFFDEDTGQLAVDPSGNFLILVGSPGIFQMDMPGDINCDGQVNLLDVAPFVDLIVDGVFSNKADINGDGQVDLLDVGPFVELLAVG